jgi:hypothetical protein
MVYQTEAKFQCWRATAVTDRSEIMLYLGRSAAQVRAGYPAVFAELLDADERSSVSQIILQCWWGAADQGRWLTKSVLPIPHHRPLFPGAVLAPAA